MKKLFAIVAILLISAFALAQTAAPSPTPNPQCAASTSATSQPATSEANCGLHFITGSAFYQLANGKQATEFDARLPLTPKYSFFAATFMIPAAKGNIVTAGGEFRERLSHLFKNPTAKGYNLNLSKIEVFGRFGLGSEANNALTTTVRSFAYSVEGGAEFPIMTVVGGPLVKTGIRIGYIGVPNSGGTAEHFVLGSNVAISPQVTISF